MTTPARPASTVCVLRDAPAGLEVLMVRRGDAARFMGGAWVFPGGVVDDVDGTELARSVVRGDVGEEERRWVAAGLRELAEEVGIWITTDPIRLPPAGRPRGVGVYRVARDRGVRLDGNRLAYFANWITPTMIPVRFDTRFYAVALGAAERATPDPDPAELAAAEWLAPESVLELARRGERTVPFPTRKALEHLARFGTADEVVADARGMAEVPAVLPRTRTRSDGRLEVILPGEPGYEEVGDEEPPPETLAEATRASAPRPAGPPDEG